MNAEIAIPLSQWDSYYRRIQQETAPSLLQVKTYKDVLGRECVETHMDKRLGAMIASDMGMLHDSEVYRLRLNPDSILLPTESEPNFFLRPQFQITLGFYRGDRVEELLRYTSQPDPDPDLEMSVNQAESKEANMPDLWYAPGIGAMIVSFSVKPKIDFQSEAFVSALDLADSTATTYVFGSEFSQIILVPTVRLHFGKGYGVMLDKNCKPSSPNSYVCRVTKSNEYHAH